MPSPIYTNQAPELIFFIWMKKKPEKLNFFISLCRNKTKMMKQKLLTISPEVLLAKNVIFIKFQFVVGK